MRPTHAAHAPATGPTPPSTVSCDLMVGADHWSALIESRPTVGIHFQPADVVRSVFLWKTDLTPTFQMAGNTLDASADNGEDGDWFFWLALHGATHP
ncbi:hypothetical protein N5D20_15900 [Stenotrophomonas sp. GD03877]|nr:hypothetical protein [Stenotrophomonas sp. GD03877]MDH0877174.1 hypothetical protein [Stenotrophomonas sp. GD03877]